MMSQLSTADALNKLNDSAFELLADSILRATNADCESLIHIGVNETGKTVKAPVDGFCQVSDSRPPRFVLVQHTTTARKSLGSKWLNADVKITRSGVRNKGDLVKASEQAAVLRKSFPDAEFLIVLTTNQRPDLELCERVAVFAAEHKLSVEIWEQTRIARFLDNDPQGQWLRWRYLNIAAERLSTPLLHELSRKSLEAYSQMFPTDRDLWISRRIETAIDATLQTSDGGLTFLIAESGLGKSVLSARALSRWIGKERLGIRVTGENLAEALSLQHLVSRALRELQPALWPNADCDALDLVAKKPLLLVVDDINRCPDPVSLARKLVGLMRPTDNGSSMGVKAICPIWPSTVSQIGSETKAFAWVDTISFGHFESDEARDAVERAVRAAKVELSELEKSLINEELSRDPYLIGLWGQIVSSNPRRAPRLTRDIQRQFLSDYLAFVANESPGLTEGDFHAAISRLCEQMLVRRCFQPRKSEVDEWFSSQSLINGAISALLKQKKRSLIALQDDGIIEFRHDRLRDYLLQKALPSAIAIEPNLIAEPFFARYIGSALANGVIPAEAEVLERVMNENPLSLFEAIREGTQFGKVSDAIVAQAHRWIENSVLTQKALPHLVEQVSETLLQIDNPITLKFAERMPTNNYVLLARLRNGDARAGAQYCRRYKGVFQPSMRSRYFEEVVNHASRYHFSKILDATRGLLAGGSPLTRLEVEGALVIAGFLASDSLLEDIASSWERSGKSSETLPYALWAMLRCARSEDYSTFEHLLNHWSLLSADKRNDEVDQGNVYSWLRGSFRWIDSDAAIQWLKRAGSYPTPVAKYLHLLICEIDHPDAAEFSVRHAASVRKTSQSYGGPSFVRQFQIGRWNPAKRSGSRLSNTTQDRLRGLWQNKCEEFAVQAEAFELWRLGASTEDLPYLQRFDSTHKLFESSLRRRAELGDHTVANEVAIRMRKDSWWCWYGSSVWCAPISEALDAVVTALRDSPQRHDLDNVRDLLIRIPRDDAEKVLENWWHHFGNADEFVFCALYVGTERTRELANQSITTSDNPERLFEHIELKSSCRRHGEPSDEAGQLRFLQNLEPHLHRISKNEIEHLSWGAEYGKFHDWYATHLIQYLSPQRRAYLFPSDADLLEELTRLSASEHKDYRAHLWFENLQRRSVANSRIWPVLGTWFDHTPDAGRAALVAECVGESGTRQELWLLERVLNAGCCDKLQRQLADANYRVRARTLR